MEPKRPIEQWMQSNNLALLEYWARDGLTESDIAERMGIARKTLFQWKSKEPKIADALREGKELIDCKVESALFRAALGYTLTETKVIAKMKGGELVDVVKEKITREYPPNVHAIQMWLCNRQREKWRRNPETGIESAEERSIDILIKRAE